MRTISVVIAVMTAATIAAAQPGQAPPPAQQPPQGYPQQPPPGYPPQQQQPPQGYLPPPYAYQPVALTEEDRDLLESGEISDGQHLGGGIAALFVGLGVGQAVQGRWHETGWIFTLGETASMVAFMWGFFEMFNESSQSQTRGETLFVGGMIGLAGFRIWEIVDAFTGPPAHNARLHQLRMRLGMPPSPTLYGHVGPYLAPVHGGGGGVAGVTLRF
jgi:hypothetical protein